MKQTPINNIVKFASLLILALVIGLTLVNPIQASINAPTAVLSLDANSNLQITESGGNTDDPIAIRYDGASFTVAHLGGGTLNTAIAGASGSGSNTVKIPAASVTGSQIIFDAGGGNDTLTIDIGDNSTPFTKAIIFNGQGQTVGDGLILIGSATITEAEFGFTNETDGTVDLTGNATITYTGLEPITSTINATNVTLNYGSSSENILISDAGGNQTMVDSNIGGETVTFNDPTGTLTINAGAGDDSIQINSLTPSYPANLNFTGAADTDEIEIMGFTTLGAGKNSTFTAETISQSAQLWVPGTLTLDASSSGTIALTHTSNNFGTLVITDADTAVITDRNNLILETITTQTSFFVTSIQGALQDGTIDESVNVTTTSAAFRALSGIGNAATDTGDLDIAVSELAALTTQGDIAISDDGALEVTAVDGLTGLSITVGGSGDEILLRDGVENGTEILDILEPISNAGNGDITIYADGNVVGDELEIEADIWTNGGDITLAAYGTLDFNAAPTITTTNNGTISVHAGATFSFSTGVTITGGTSSARLTGAGDYALLTPRGDITLTAPDLINVEMTNADSDGTGAKGTVRIWADVDGNNSGEIFDTQGGEVSFIIADTLIMRSADGIGDASGIETTVDTLIAYNNDFGDIIISNTAVTLTTGSASGISGIINDGNGTIELETTGALAINTPISGNDDVTITAGGDIIDLNDTGADISGAPVTLDGNLSPGGSSVGVLAVEGNTTLASTGGLAVNLTGSTNSGPHDQLSVAGDVTIESGAVFTLDLTTYTTYESGTITVINNTGSFSGEFAGFPNLTQTNPGSTPNFVVEYSSMVLRAYLAVTPTVSISYAAPSTATLTWADYSSNCTYTSFRSDQPYQGESAPSTSATSPQVDSSAGLTNYFYTIRANGCAGDTALSSEVGVFHFGLETGN